MALLIIKDLNLSGLTSNQLYIRTNLLLDFDGKRVMCRMVPYYSKKLWVEDSVLNGLHIPKIFSEYQIDYNASVNGEILLYIHNELKSILSTDIMEDVPVLNPKTGDYQYDLSTRKLITENVVTIPKFADISEITIVDLD